MKRATHPFEFRSHLVLVELTGWTAKNLTELVEKLRNAPDSVVYHHTHHFLQQHLWLSPEPPNDFAYWVRNSLEDDLLAEKLAAISPLESQSVSDLRDRIVATIAEHTRKSRNSRECPEGEEFRFMKATLFITPTSFVVWTLKEFADAIEHVSIHSLYYHMVEARLRLGKPTNDFSFWLSTSLDENWLAGALNRIDPYTYTMEGLRRKILELVQSRIT